MTESVSMEKPLIEVKIKKGKGCSDMKNIANSNRATSPRNKIVYKSITKTQFTTSKNTHSDVFSITFCIV